MTPRPRRSPRRGASAGFTLIELTVALLAGLIVAMGIIGLSREATRTFHEEVRSSAAEATLRTAVDRLRADLQRAGYMSTASLAADLMIAKAPGESNFAHVPAGWQQAGMGNLASIQLISGGSQATNGLTLSTAQTPALNPDAVLIAGNMTSAEQFEVELIEPPSGSCQRILLSSASGAMYRVAATGNKEPSAELRNLFQPVPAGASTQFMVRLVDDTGRQQFLATCLEAQAAGFIGTPPNAQAYVDIDASNTPILTAQQTKTQGGVSGYSSGRALVNPVQIVRWEITSAALEAQNLQQYAGALDNQSTQYGQIDPNKYDLMRTYVDVMGNVVPDTAEVVAEYAVDLKFAFSVDQGTITNPSIVTYTFDDVADNIAWAAPVSGQKAPPYVPGPQRIRQVRARIATRTQLADRSANVPVANFGNDTYLYRYCINTTPSCTANDGVLRWARVRTVTTEVSLPNDARSFF